jgi:hypothetical protein
MELVAGEGTRIFILYMSWSLVVWSVSLRPMSAADDYSGEPVVDYDTAILGAREGSRIACAIYHFTTVGYALLDTRTSERKPI